MRLPARIAAALAACALTLSIPTVGTAATVMDTPAADAAAEATTALGQASADQASTASGPVGDPGAAAAGGTTAGSSGGSQPIMLIIDGSGSMKAADVDDKGTTRMDAAKDAAKDVIDNLNDNAQVGLTAYGMNTGSADSEKAAGCKDIEVLSKVGPIDADGLKKQVDSIKASGYTPIGEALKKAAAELPGDGNGGIVLLSDGEDTCAPPPPCDVAKELVKDGLDLKIHTVGLRVDEKARKELTCIADETKGTYADAEDTTSLQSSMQAAARAALTGYEAQGTPITGGGDRASAVDIQPGQYLDSLPTGSGDVTKSTAMRSYKFHLDAGERGLLSATMVQPWSDSGLVDYDAVKLVVSSATEESCMRTDTTLANAMNLGDLPPSAFVDTGAIGPDNARIEGSKCFTEPGEYIVTAERTGGSEQTKDTPFPLELNLVVQPGVKADDFPDPAASAQQQDFLPAPGQPTPLAGGTSFGTAPELKNPSVTSTINVGEVQYFKVPVKYGQQIRARADFEVPGKEKSLPANPNLWILNPLRQQVTSVRPGEPGAHDFDNQEDILGKDGHAYASSRNATVLALNSAVPVNPRNLDGEDDPKFPTSQASFDGFYYIAFSYSDIQRKSFGTPGEYTLSWDVVGDPIDGPGAAGAGDTAGDGGDAKADGGGDSVLMSALKWGGIALGAIVLIGAVLVVILLLRTRRARIGS